MPQEPVVRVIRVGYVGANSTAASADAKKKPPQSSGEFAIELPAGSPFTVNPLKGTLESGSTKEVSFTFSVPKDGKAVGKAVDAACKVILKSDTTTAINLALKGLVVK